MSNRFVRSSKYRHIFGTQFKKDQCYDNIKISKGPHESDMCSVNSKFLAVILESQGGGAFLVTPLSKTGRFDINYPKVSGHKNPVLDIAWNPFNDNEIASASEDCTVKLWNIPDEGLVNNFTEDDAICSLAGHQRKVTYVVWHPCASDVLLSAGGDFAVFIWNTKTKEAVLTISVHEQLIQSVSWNYDGSCFATSCKDKKIRIFDAHTGDVLSEGKGHEGNKPSKVVFCGTKSVLFSSGFSRMSDRQYALWDPSDLTKPLTLTNIDTGSGVLFPFWDNGTGVVYLAGKGDTQIRLFEVTEDKAPYVHFLNMFMPSAPATQHRGVGAMPKRNLDFMKCEVMRFYRLIQTKGFVEPVSMTVPRKSEMFQDDIYPPTPAGKPSLSAEEWFGGKNLNPMLVKFTASGIVEQSQQESQIWTNPGIKGKDAATAKKEPSVMKRFNSPQPDDAKAQPVTLDEYRVAYKELQEENAALRAKLAKLEGK